MNNKRGQSSGYLGLVVVAAVLIICGVIFFVATANTAQPVTTLNTINNQTGFSFPANGSSITLNGQALASGTTPIVINASTGQVIAAGNYTVRNYQAAGAGGYVVTLTSTGNPINYAGNPVNVTYSYEPIGYATDAGSRSIVGLILVFCALIIMAAALTPVVRSGFLEILGMR